MLGSCRCEMRTTVCSDLGAKCNTLLSVHPSYNNTVHWWHWLTDMDCTVLPRYTFVSGSHLAYQKEEKAQIFCWWLHFTLGSLCFCQSWFTVVTQCKAWLNGDIINSVMKGFYCSFSSVWGKTTEMMGSRFKREVVILFHFNKILRAVTITFSLKYTSILTSFFSKIGVYVFPQKRRWKKESRKSHCMIFKDYFV